MRDYRQHPDYRPMSYDEVRDWAENGYMVPSLRDGLAALFERLDRTEEEIRTMIRDMTHALGMTTGYTWVEALERARVLHRIAMHAMERQ